MFGLSGKNKKIVRTLPSSTIGGRVISVKKKNNPTSINNHIWLRILMRFLVLVFFGVSVYILFFSQFVVVNSIAVIGAQNIDEQAILDVARESIRGKRAGFLMKNNLILVSKMDIENALEGKFKRIEGVEIIKQFPDKLLIKIKERESILVFCSGDPCWVVDKEGHIYAQADFETNELGERDLIILRDLSQKSVEPETFFISTELVRFISDIKNKLERELDIVVKQECQTKTLVSGDIEFETTSDWKIYFNYDVGENKSIEMLKTALNNALDKDKQSNLDYVDLRLDNKVYYKLKNEIVAAETDPATIAPAVVPVVEKKKK